MMHRNTKKTTTLPVLKRIAATADIRLLRDGDQVILDGPAPADLVAEFTAAYADIRAQAIPAVTEKQRAQVRHLLGDLQVQYITDQVAAQDAVWKIAGSSADCLAIDTETAALPAWRVPVPVTLTATGTVAKRQPKSGAAGAALNPRRANVRLLQVFDGGDTVYLFDMHAVAWDTVAPLLTGSRTLIMHNATFDVAMIASSGLPAIMDASITDTMTAMRLIDGTRPSMADAAAVMLDVELPKTLGASDWSIPELSADQLAYAALDPVITRDLYQAQRAVMDDADINAQHIVDAAIGPVVRMELAGMPFDMARHQEMMQDWSAKNKEATAAVAAHMHTGTGLPTPTQVIRHIEQQATPEQLNAWPRTETGRIQTSQATLKIHGANIPGIPELLQARRWAKAISTYGDSLHDRVENGRLYGQFLIAGARSGRASSREPNLQNLPKRSAELSDFREIFRAPPGRTLVAADYSQIELRALAALSGDDVMNDLYRNFGRVHQDKAAAKQFDLHTLTARSFADGEPTAADRSIAKAINFSLAYGSGPNGVRAYAESSFGVRMTREEAVERIEAFKRQYAGVTRWQENQEQESRRLGYTMTVGGRRWRWDWSAAAEDADLDHLEDWQVSDAVSGFQRNYALNHPIQGSCAELMWAALQLVDDALRPYDARVIGIIHDEILVESAADADTVRAVRRVLNTKMTRAWLTFFPGAPWRGIVDINVAGTWADAH